MPLSHLTDHSAPASRSRIECVRAGLAGPEVDRPIWISAANARIEELEKHGRLFGLESFEQEEIRALRQLVETASQPTRL
jgi:hypothetical protein